MSDLKEPLSVQAALSLVMAELPNIGKGDRSPEGYEYRGIEAVTQHVQPLFAKHGVVVVPSAEVTDVRPSPAMKDGWTDVFMRVGWTIIGPDGSTLTAQTFGIGRDRTDKGANKAQTQAFKYLLLHLLCIADRKDDAEQHDYRNEYAEPPPREFNLSAFLRACKDADLDPADVLAFAEVAKPLEELTLEDRPALLAAIKAMAKAAGDSEEAPQ